MSSRAELAKALAEIKELNEAVSKLSRGYSPLYDWVDELKKDIILSDGLLIGTEWEAEIRGEHVSLSAYHGVHCFRGLFEVMGKDDTIEFDDFMIQYHEGIIRICDLKMDLATFISKFKLKVDWRSLHSLDESIEDAEKRLSSMKSVRELVNKIKGE